MKKKILDLKPTQFSVGLKDVDDKISKIKSTRSKKQEKKIPVIVGPKGDLYMIDHHHFVRAMWECGKEHVHVEIKANYSRLSVSNFWKKMNSMKYVFLYDHTGNGPHNYKFLPDDIRGMSDDKYRSLAWIIRENGGFDKSTIPFSEFYWAQFFRKNLKVFNIFSREGIRSAMRLCKSKNAKNLPGFKE